jgi:hypothetical protein
MYSEQQEALVPLLAAAIVFVWIFFLIAIL